MRPAGAEAGVEVKGCRAPPQGMEGKAGGALDELELAALEDELAALEGELAALEDELGGRFVGKNPLAKMCASPEGVLCGKTEPGVQAAAGNPSRPSPNVSPNPPEGGAWVGVGARGEGAVLAESAVVAIFAASAVVIGVLSGC